MCKQKLLRTFSLHMVPKGVPPLDTPTATPSGSPHWALLSKLVNKVDKPTNLKLPATMPSVMLSGSSAMMRKRQDLSRRLQKEMPSSACRWHPLHDSVTETIDVRVIPYSWIIRMNRLGLSATI